MYRDEGRRCLILFLDNGANHLLYERVARALAEDSVPAGVLYFSVKKYSAADVDPARKFYIDLRPPRRDAELAEGSRVIEQLERTQAEFTLARTIAIDRAFRFSPQVGERTLTAFAARFRSLLLENRVTLVLGELTWGLELVAHYVAADLGITYANPLTVSAFPSPRVAFFDTHNSLKHMARIAQARPDVEVPLDDLVRARRSSDINQVTGVHLRRSFSPSALARAWDYVANGVTSDYRYGLGHKVRFTLPKVWNKWLLEGPLRSMFATSIPSGVRTVLLPLHVQPEATPDTVAHEYSNQLEVARLISIGLPHDAMLLVKEHPNDVGCRSPRTLRRFGALPRTMIVAPNWPMRDLLATVDMVVSVAGTVLMEAALEGVPAFALSDVYFSGLSGITRIRDPLSLVAAVKRTLRGPRELRANEELSTEDSDLLRLIYRGSFEGVVHHPRMVPLILSDINVRRVTEACEFFWKLEAT